MISRFQFGTFNLIWLLSFQLIFGQVKNEREERVKLSSFPAVAQDLIKRLPSNCKRIKFYKETDNKKSSFEAKFKQNKQRYSLEFSEDGIMEDLELTVRYKSISQTSKNKISHYFKHNYDKYSVVKIQKQFINTRRENPSVFVNEILSGSYTYFTHYEIIAEIKHHKKREVAEFTFSNTGEFISIRILEPTSYEYVLY